MDLEQFLFRSGSHSGALNSRHCNQDPLGDARELARCGLKLFPVSLLAKLAGNPDRRIADATDDVSLLEELSAAAQPLWGYRVALGPSGLCVLVLEGAVGRASFAALVPDLADCFTLQARRGDVLYAFFRQPVSMQKIVPVRKLAPGVSILGDCSGFDLPPNGGAAWINPGAEIETLPYALRELLGLEPPDSPPGHTMPTPKPTRSVPCRSAVRFLQPDKTPRRGHPVCGWRSGYRIPRGRQRFQV